MPLVITAADRGSFQRCRRQWDFGAGNRQNLEPLRPPPAADLDRALRDALAVYYYPGMWDWDRDVRLPLVAQGLERALTRQRERRGDSDDGDPQDWPASAQAARDLLARYVEWAPAADRFAPVLAEADYEVTVLDPARSEAGLVTAEGEEIRYRGRIDLMAVDEHDAYWIVRHRLIEGDWPRTDDLAADEETITACWAWEHFYIGMGVAGVIWNEMRLPPASPGPLAPARPRKAREPRWRRLRAVPSAPSGPAIRQHEPSGGGRSIPQHRRMYAQARPPRGAEPVEQQVTGAFRRTWLRRGTDEVRRAGLRLAADVAAMSRGTPDVTPNPSDRNCPPCPYLDPCRAMFAGDDPDQILRAGYRTRPPDVPEEGRLGGASWSTGRGAAPPRFRGPGRA
jgi:hypothetical protein